MCDQWLRSTLRLEDGHFGSHLSNLLGELEFFMLDGHQTFLEELVLLLDGMLFAFELFHLLSLSFPRGLGGLAIPQHSLDATLFFLILRLCPFPDRS